MVTSTFRHFEGLYTSSEAGASVEIPVSIHQVISDYKSFQAEEFTSTRAWRTHIIVFCGEPVNS